MFWFSGFSEENIMVNTGTCAAILGLVTAIAVFGAATAYGDPEIPKSRMLAAASSEYADAERPGRAIDDSADTYWRATWWANDPNSHLRIFLGSRCSVSQFDFLPFADNQTDRVTEYELYVTDSLSGGKAD
jgi:hypothetical protein